MLYRSQSEERSTKDLGRGGNGLPLPGVGLGVPAVSGTDGCVMDLEGGLCSGSGRMYV